MQFLTTTTESYISLFFTLALMLVLLYFMIYRPQKKQEKKDAAMRWQEHCPGRRVKKTLLLEITSLRWQEHCPCSASQQS